MQEGAYYHGTIKCPRLGLHANPDPSQTLFKERTHMSIQRHEIASFLTWDEGLPRPQWDVIAAELERRSPPEEQAAAWVDVAQQWLEALGEALGGGYAVEESEHFLLLAPEVELLPRALLCFAEECRRGLLGILPGVADLHSPGKQVVIVLPNADDYYQYVSAFYGEGHYGGSVGLHIRDGYPHIALCGPELGTLEITLAHEMTHASLVHLDSPQWLEEGMAQLFEHDMSRGRAPFSLDGATARRHRRHWSREGLDAFWSGEGFARPGKVQNLSYQLAEILLRLLAEEHRPRWFGFSRQGPRRLLAFFQEAKAGDAGLAAAEKHLTISLADLAARFLGPGDWGPRLA